MVTTRRPSAQTLAVLRTLADDVSRWSHGYELCQELGLKAGTIYPILIRLSERGLVEAEWEQSPQEGRPPRHLYRLSPAGAEFAAQHVAAHRAAAQQDAAPRGDSRAAKKRDQPASHPDLGVSPA